MGGGRRREEEGGSTKTDSDCISEPARSSLSASGARTARVPVISVIAVHVLILPVLK